MKKLLPALFVCAVSLFALNLRAQDQAAAPAYHAAIVNSIGKYVMSVDGKPDVAALKTKKYLFVYFSADWCPPCHRFTPDLVKFYNKNYPTDDFGLIFVSLDRSKTEMSGYMQGAKMPWIGVPQKSAAGKLLKDKCAGKSIPCLMLLDENDNVIAESHDKYGDHQGADNALRAYTKLKKAELKKKQAAEKQKSSK